MPSTNIPGRRPYQPPIPGPEQAPPRVGRKWLRESRQTDESGMIFERYVTVSRYQYWQQIHSHDFECGAVHTMTVSTTIGASATQSAEVASALGVSQDGISASLSSKLSSSITVTAQTTSSHQITETAPPCKGVTLVSWQLVEEYEVNIIDEGLFGYVSDTTYTLTVPLDIYDDDKLVYDRASCCQTKTAMLWNDGYREAYAMAFPGAQVVLLGAPTKEGLVALNGVEGKYQLGGPVPMAALPEDLAGFVNPHRSPENTFAVLEMYRGDPAPVFYAVDLSTSPGFTKAESKILDLASDADEEALVEATNMAITKPQARALLAARAKYGGRFGSIQDLAESNGVKTGTVVEVAKAAVTRGSSRYWCQ